MPWRDHAGTGLAAVGFLALSLLLNAGLLPRLTDALPGNLGDPMLNAWILGWVSEALVAHPWDLWDAPIFHPHPNTLAYSEHLLGVAVFVAPVYWMTGNAVLTYNVAFLAGYALAGLAMFVLVRRLTGRVDAAAVAGVLFACSPYLASSQIARLQMLTCGWSVLALAELHRFVDSGRRQALVGFVACWVLQTLSNMYLGVFLALPIAVVVLHGAVLRRPRLGLTPLLQIVAGGAVLAVLLTPVLVVYDRVQDDMGFAHGLEIVQRYSADLRSYLSVWMDRRPRLLWPEISADRAVYPGAAVIGLAALAVWAAIRRRADRGLRSSVALYVVIAIAAVALSLGPEPSVWERPLGLGSPYGLLLDLVPGFDGFRAPARFALPVLIALAVLAGLAVAAMPRDWSWRRGVAATLLAVVVVADARRPFAWVEPVPAEDPSTTAAYAWLADQPRAPVLKLPIATHFQAQRPDAGASVTLRYQLAALRHHKPLINGSSGFMTPLVSLLQSAASPLTTRDTMDDGLAIVRALGGRYVIVHLHEYRLDARGHVDELLGFMRQDTDQVEQVHEFGSTVIFTLRPAPPALPPVRAEVLSPTHYQLAVSHNPERLSHLVDGDPGSRWTGPQHGNTWLEVQLRRARPVAGVKLHLLPYAISEYPHHLRVIGTGTDGSDVVLFDEAAVTVTALNAVFEPAAPGVRITWPPIVLSRLRLEQRGLAGDRQWSIFELQVLDGGPGGVAGG
ncbi:MAG: hypothetical protein AB7U83_19055 [Vicinamibacterales bacterium]